MIRGLYTSALGMITQMNKMNIVTNNIANVDTTGYKKDTSVTRSFSNELMSRLDDPADLMHDTKIGKIAPGVFIDDIYTDFRNGSFKITNGPLDLAIRGEGFFCVAVKDGNGGETEKYTRCGEFTLDENRTLKTKEGYVVLGEEGPIVIENGTVVIDEGGQVFVNTEVVGRLKLVDFEDKHTLRKFGDTCFNTTADSVVSAFTGSINSGCLENSNVNSVKEMVDLITVSRTYEANQRMVMIQDTILAKSTSEVGRK